jgi:hypothetical protein
MGGRSAIEENGFVVSLTCIEADDRLTYGNAFQSLQGVGIFAN